MAFSKEYIYVLWRNSRFVIQTHCSPVFDSFFVRKESAFLVKSSRSGTLYSCNKITTTWIQISCQNRIPAWPSLFLFFTQKWLLSCHALFRMQFCYIEFILVVFFFNLKRFCCSYKQPVLLKVSLKSRPFLSSFWYKVSFGNI